MKKLVLISIIVSLSAPAAGQMFRDIPESEANVYPAAYRSEILKNLKETLKDPTSVKDASISKPILNWQGAGNRYIVCVKFNAKNNYGGYGGKQDHSAVFVRGRLSTIGEPIAGECRTAVYEKFSELERLK